MNRPLSSPASLPFEGKLTDGAVTMSDFKKKKKRKGKKQKKLEFTNLAVIDLTPFAGQILQLQEEVKALRDRLHELEIRSPLGNDV